MNNIAAIFPGHKNVKILSFSDRYCKITAPNTTSNWGTVLIASTSGFFVAGIRNNSEPVTIDSSENNSVVISTNGLTTTIDVGNDYSHSLVLIGGSLGSADISFN